MLFCALAMGCGAADTSKTTEPNTAPVKTRVLLLSHASVDAAVVSNALLWAEQNTYVEWELDVASFAKGKAPAEVLAELATHQGESWFGIIGVGPLMASVPVHLQADTNQMVAVVNTAALAHDDQAVFTRRLERQFIRAYASLLGMGPSPNPRCCLFPYRTTAMLDQIGRNCCPPFEIKMRKLGKARGLEERVMPLPSQHRLLRPKSDNEK